MKENKYLIRFSDGRYLQKGSPRYSHNGTSSLVQTRVLDDARVFADFETAERIKSQLNVSFATQCEIEAKS